MASKRKDLPNGSSAGGFGKLYRRSSKVEDVVGKLVLQDGTSHEGISFGAPKSIAGEVVFNTGMVGYPEALTDPSYRGQILVLTFPLIGNYGVPSEEEKDDLGLPKHFESSEIHIAGLIVQEYSLEHSHWTAVKSLGEWLQQHGVPALYNVDSRMLAKKIRNHGSMLGKIEIGDESVAFEDPNKRNLVDEVSLKTPRLFNEGGAVFAPREGQPLSRVIAFDCGIKYNIIRFLVRKGVELFVVPYDYDLANSDYNYDGIFISNGPGDPVMAGKTVESIKWAMKQSSPKPIFGICLGNQILALAVGAKTYKMKFGNRSMNQPCIDMRTTRCYITPQNHGYAVDSKSLPEDWKTFFMNANDHSNEGIVHVSKPFFSVQFHPEACGGPTDTSFLFDMFLERVAGFPAEITLLDTSMYDRPQVNKVLLIGSGGLSIGQAGEFDYSGSQAIKALKEEGVEVVLINPNIATVQTSKGMADKVYFLPVLANTVLEVIKKEKPDGILVSMGGQTALNVGIELYNSGVLEQYGVRVLGTQIPAIVDTEDREKFSEKLKEIGETAAQSLPATNIDEALRAAETIGYPVLVRAAFALGGLGSGFASNPKELEVLASKAFASSSQILIDQDLRGWKEVEYEVVRDSRDNCITVCNMENFDPLGIHTGDSIVVAPSQTLSNKEYFKLRAVAQKVVRHLGIVGECNIQYALSPDSERYCIIEVNARLSRSSALASKATGYPLAYVAAKLSLGVDLVSIKNSVTKTTTACFEPSLDYCVVKMPRWDLKKFNRVSTDLGSRMLSVGEVMSIGRNFEEAIQKAVRMVNPNLNGLDESPLRNSTLVRESEPDGNEGVADVDMNGGHEDTQLSKSDLENVLVKPTDERIFYVMEALARGYSVDRLYALTKIDRWFLSKLKNIAEMKREFNGENLDRLDERSLRRLKCTGFSDAQIAELVDTSELVVRRKRCAMGVVPVVKQIDTLAAEYPASTNYLFMTYNGQENDVSHDAEGVMVLGCGPYCIGSSVEFDWCAVSAVRTIRKTGKKAIVVNCNPETVSTDYDESDRLYFEELTLERVVDIYEHEAAHGVVVSVGGQIPNNLSLPLYRFGVNVLGTSPESIDTCEDRNKFSALLDSLSIDQPEWAEVTSVSSAVKFSHGVGFPVLVRPSYVLSGAAMRVCADEAALRNYLVASMGERGLSEKRSICVSKFIVNAKEIEFDGVANDGHIVNYAISEHVENAGVHSGDATLVLPAQKLYVKTIKQVKRIASAVSLALKISGPFNMQLMARDNDVKVIELNLRASRTFPFISKTFDFNFISLATKVMLDLPVKPFPIALVDIDYVAVKAPQFSFTRLQGADPTLGVEMASTGEVACFGTDVSEAYLKALLSSGFKLPQKNRSIFLSLASEESKLEFLESALALNELKYKLYGTEGTAKFFADHGVKIETLYKQQSSPEASDNTAVKYLASGKIDLLINVSEGGNRETETIGYQMRRSAVDFGVSLVTNLKCAVMLVQSLKKVRRLEIMHIDEYYHLPTVGWTIAHTPQGPTKVRKLSIA